MDFTSDSESDLEIRPSSILDMMQIDDAVNETAVSYRESVDETGGNLEEASNKFSQYYKEKLMIPKEGNFKRFQDDSLFEKYREKMKVYPPVPRVYYIPTVILFEGKVNMLELRNIIQSKLRNRVSAMIHNDRPHEVSVAIHDQKEISFYILRCASIVLKKKHKCPRLLERDLSIDVLYELYSKCYNNHYEFDQTCGILLYWAYQRKLLNSDNLSESSIKMLCMFLFINIGEGVNNFVSLYKKQKLISLTKKYKVNKKLECELNSDLFNYSNFSIKQTRSFYKQSLGKFTTMTQILVVPFPVEDEERQDLKKVIDKKIEVRQNQRNIVKPLPALMKFKKLMEILSRFIKNSSKITIDLENKKGNQQTEEGCNFNIEIIHPIFNDNICENLTKDPSKLMFLKNEIQSTIKIFESFKHKPLVALCKIFEKKD